MPGHWVRVRYMFDDFVAVVIAVRELNDPMECDKVMIDAGKGNGAWMIVSAAAVRLLE
jgi:hypothetical protein